MIRPQLNRLCSPLYLSSDMRLICGRVVRRARISSKVELSSSFAPLKVTSSGRNRSKRQLYWISRYRSIRTAVQVTSIIESASEVDTACPKPDGPSGQYGQILLVDRLRVPGTPAVCSWKYIPVISTTCSATLTTYSTDIVDHKRSACEWLGYGRAAFLHENSGASCIDRDAS